MKKGILIGISGFVLIFAAIFLVNNQTDKTATKTSTNTQKPAATVEKPSDSKTEELAGKIKEKYQAEFQEINDTAAKTVDSLIVQARNEFKMRQTRKEDLSQFKQKYLAIFNNNEQKSKQHLDEVYQKLEKELVDNKLPKTAGEEFIESYRFQKQGRLMKLRTELEKISLKN